MNLLNLVQKQCNIATQIAHLPQFNRPGGRTMALIDELFLFLVRIRLGLFQQDLVHRFNVHESTVSRKVVTWAN